jgi:hypothetical protein
VALALPACVAMVAVIDLNNFYIHRCVPVTYRYKPYKQYKMQYIHRDESVLSYQQFAFLSDGKYLSY